MSRKFSLNVKSHLTKHSYRGTHSKFIQCNYFIVIITVCKIKLEMITE